MSVFMKTVLKSWRSAQVLFARQRLSKPDDIKIKRNVSLFSLSLLSYLPCGALFAFFFVCLFVSLDLKAFRSREIKVYMGYRELTRFS